MPGEWAFTLERDRMLATFDVSCSFSVRPFIDSCKAVDEGEIGHFTRSSACAFSIIDHGEVNTVIGVDPSYLTVSPILS
jgi:hypothetical protein